MTTPADAVIRLAPRGTHSVVVLVDKLDRAVLRAVRYATALGATDVRAVHAAVDPERASALADRWMDATIPVPASTSSSAGTATCRGRWSDASSSLSAADSEVTAVMPRRDFPKLRQRLLHDRTSRKIAKALGRYPHVDVRDGALLLRAPGRRIARTDERVGAPSGRPVGWSAAMKVIVMGFGRVGAAAHLASSSTAGHEVVRDRQETRERSSSIRLQPTCEPDRRPRVRTEMCSRRPGSRKTEGFVAVSSGDNSNIVSARVALEHYHVPKVVARIYDPRRADIYERLNIPTVATTKWGVKQIQLMLFHDR